MDDLVPKPAAQAFALPGCPVLQATTTAVPPDPPQDTVQNCGCCQHSRSPAVLEKAGVEKTMPDFPAQPSVPV